MRSVIKSKLSENLPFILLFLFMGFIHIFISPTWGDDLLFRSITEGNGWSLIDFLYLRYGTWTSRILIESVLFSIIGHIKLWKLLDALFFSLIPFFVSRILKCNKRTNYIICLFALIFPFSVFGEAGWMATSINYLWPLCMFLFAAFVLSKYYRSDGHINVVWMILAALAMLFSSNAEQCAVLGFVALCLMMLQLLIGKKRRLLIFPAIILLINIISLIFIYTCPGNSQRVAVEIDNYFPNFDSLGFIDKVLNGAVNSFRLIITMGDFFTITLLVTLLVLVYRTRKNNYEVIFPLIPLFLKISYLGNAVLNDNSIFSGSDYSGMTEHFFSRIFPSINAVQDKSDMSGSFWIIFVYYIIIVVCILISIYFIWRDDKLRSIFYMIAMLTGFGLVAILGFSPTIYASGFRITMYFLFIFAFVLLASYKHIEENAAAGSEKCDIERKYNPVLIYMGISAAILNWIGNIYGIFLILAQAG